MVGNVVSHLEDICLGIGSVLVSFGAGVRFGPWAGLTVAGFLLVAYGVWITPKKAK